MSHTYDLEEASALLPEVALRIKMMTRLRSRLDAEIADHPLPRRVDGYRSPAAFSLNEDLLRVVAWFGDRDIQIKGLGPALVDFPASSGGELVLLCWREGEDEIGWFHRPEDGFAGRRPIAELTA